MIFRRKKPSPARPHSPDRIVHSAVLARLDRNDEGLWQGTRSCLGGVPPLGPDRWPDGLHCVAQIDLTELTAVLPWPAPQQTGLLVAFADLVGWTPQTGCLIHVEHGDEDDPSSVEPPPLTGDGGEPIFPGRAVESEVPRHLPRWPVAVHPIEQRIFDLGTQRFEDRFRVRVESDPLPFSGPPWPHETLEAITNPDEPWPAMVGHRLLVEMMRVIGPQDPSPRPTPEPDVDAVEAGPTRALDFIARWRPVFDNMKPLDIVPPDRIDAFWSDLWDAGRVAGRVALDWTTDVMLGTYLDLMTGTRAEFAAIPGPLRPLIATYARAPSWQGGHHRVLSANIDERGGVPWSDTERVVLQVASDPAARLSFGLDGSLQFNLSPEDLSAGRFEAARMRVVYNH